MWLTCNQQSRYWKRSERQMNIVYDHNRSWEPSWLPLSYVYIYVDMEVNELVCNQCQQLAFYHMPSSNFVLFFSILLRV